MSREIVYRTDKFRRGLLPQSGQGHFLVRFTTSSLGARLRIDSYRWLPLGGGSRGGGVRAGGVTGYVRYSWPGIMSGASHPRSAVEQWKGCSLLTWYVASVAGDHEGVPEGHGEFGT